MPTLLVVLKEIKKTVLEQRIAVKKNLEVNYEQRCVLLYGICYAIEKLRDQVMYSNENQFTRLTRRWPKFSGRDEYPISTTGDARTADNEFYGRADRFGIYSTTPYTRKRMELLNWCIKELENESKT